MPGVIMDVANSQAAHTNHDRDDQRNGTNGGYAMDKGKGRPDPVQNMTPVSPNVPDGPSDSFPTVAVQSERVEQGPIYEKDENGNPTGVISHGFEGLPVEVVHISSVLQPMKKLFSRLAQRTHNHLEDKILQLAQMPVPASFNSPNKDHQEDNSPENIAKKVQILEMGQGYHDDWTKALVMHDWSRNSTELSKLIDLKCHMDQRRDAFSRVIDELYWIKVQNVGARIPGPDLKTAVEVLTTGRAEYMPDFGYIPKPPMTAKELLKELERINLLLNIRMTLHEHDNIPYHFKNFTIESGRVKFAVEGEFLLEVTIGDEDPTSQLWFIDFKFLFHPTIKLAPQTRQHIEEKVNALLRTTGLLGCYKYLHELTLTHKISELRRQAFDLSRSSWNHHLKVEILNRALCIQYWVDRYSPNGPRSYMIIGVHSGKRKDGGPDHPRTTSRLSIRWFREGKEVIDPDIEFDSNNISAQNLLKHVIAKHTRSILESMYDRIALTPLYAERRAQVEVDFDMEEPSRSVLGMQVSRKDFIKASIEHVSGRFIISPASPINTSQENQLNNHVKDPTHNAHRVLELIRCYTIAEQITTRALSVGWERVHSPRLKKDDLEAVFPKGSLMICWFRRTGWDGDWFAAMSLGMSGESWLLIETTKVDTIIEKNATKIASHVCIPITGVSPLPTYSFLSTLNIYAVALIASHTNLKMLHTKRIPHVVCPGQAPLPVTIPSIYIKLSDLLPKSKGAKGRWAKDILRLSYQGIECTQASKSASLSSIDPGAQDANPSLGIQSQQKLDTSVIMVTEARLNIRSPGLRNIQAKIDKDVAFNVNTGSVCFRVRVRIGESAIPAITDQLARFGRLAEFVDVMGSHKKIRCDSINLSRIEFSYGRVEDSYSAVVDFNTASEQVSIGLSAGNPHVRISDALNKMLNNKLGFNAVAGYIPITLPALRALDQIEEVWGTLSHLGEVFVFVHEVADYRLRYILPTSDPAARERRVEFEITVRMRRNEPWWSIRRCDSHEPDAVDEWLQKIWDFGAGSGWEGTRTSAVSRAEHVGECLAKLDEVLRAVGKGEKMPAAPVQKGIAEQAQRPVASTMLLQHPHQNQNQPQRPPVAQMGQGTNGRGMVGGGGYGQGAGGALKRKASTQGANPRAGGHQRMGNGGGSGVIQLD